MDPLIEEPAEGMPVRSFSRSLHRALVDVFQRPSRVIVAKGRAERAVTHHIAKLSIHELRAVIDHLLVDPELTKIRPARSHRLSAPGQLELPLAEIRAVV